LKLLLSSLKSLRFLRLLSPRRFLIGAGLISLRDNFWHEVLRRYE
jgi:hypothetical protein